MEKPVTAGSVLPEIPAGCAGMPLPESIATGEVLAGLGLTEPVAGSDLKSITTTLTEHGGELVINGHKSFISNAGAAGFYTTLVKEEAGLSLVLIPGDAEGLSTSPCTRADRSPRPG